MTSAESANRHGYSLSPHPNRANQRINTLTSSALLASRAMKRMVLTYWAAPTDEREFLDYLFSTREIVAYSVPWKESPEVVLPEDLLTFISKHNPAQLMMGLKDAYVVVEHHQFDERTLYNVRTDRSSLISYSRGKLEGNKLGQSNLAAYYDVAERPAEADRSFHEWCKKVYGWVRRRTPEKDPSGYYRVTSAAKLGSENGSWELSLY